MSDEPVDEWMGSTAAAKFLGTSPTQIYVYITRGDLHPRDKHPRLLRREVEALRVRREQPRLGPVRPQPTPDLEHEWLTCKDVAELLAISTVAVAQRARNERLPATWWRNRWWFRKDLLELTLAAHQEQRRHRRPRRR